IGTLVSPGASLETDGDPTHANAAIGVWSLNSLVLNDSGSNNALYAISAASQVGTTVTATVASTAGLFTGETANIAGFVPTGYNGTVTLTVLDATHFRYTAPAGLAAVTTFGAATPTPGALHNLSGNNPWAGSVNLQ